MMTRNNFAFDRSRRLKILRGAGLVYLTTIFTTLIPPALAIVITTEWEPTHVLLRDLFEFDVSLKWKHLPFLTFFTWASTSGAGVIELAVTLAVCSMQLEDTCISSMSPENVIIKLKPNQKGIRYEIETQFWGSLSDEYVVQMVRVQQVFNLLINKIYASHMFSIHHFTLLVIFVCITVVGIRFTDDIAKGGPFACVIIFCALMIPVLIENQEAFLVGENADVADDFLKQCHRMTSRRSYFRKAIRSVPRIRLESMYPYGKVSKETFTKYCMNCSDYTFTLLSF